MCLLDRAYEWMHSIPPYRKVVMPKNGAWRVSLPTDLLALGPL